MYTDKPVFKDTRWLGLLCYPDNAPKPNQTINTPMENVKIHFFMINIGFRKELILLQDTRFFSLQLTLKGYPVFDKGPCFLYLKPFKRRVFFFKKCPFFKTLGPLFPTLPVLGSWRFWVQIINQKHGNISQCSYLPYQIS